MEQHTISNHQIASFAGKLQEDERSPATIENYLRHIRAFAAWAGEQAVTKELVASWKEHLTGKDYRPGTVNTMLVSLNRFLGFLGWHDCVVKTLRIQRRLFREDSKELTREEYERLVSTAQASGRERLVLLLETICSTGIRVSEVKYITVRRALHEETSFQEKQNDPHTVAGSASCRAVLAAVPHGSRLLELHAPVPGHRLLPGDRGRNGR